MFYQKHSSKIVNEFSAEHDAYQLITSSGYTICMNDANPISLEEKILYHHYIKDLNPDIIGFSLRSYLNELSLEFIKSTKETLNNTKIIVGGFGPTLEPEVFLPYVDAVCRGEGEEALLEFCNAVSEEKAFTNIMNLSYMLEGKAIHHPLRMPKINISEYPWQFSFFEDDEKFTLIDNNEILTGDHTKTWQAYCILLWRGCLGSCAYCSGGNWITMYRDAGFKIPSRRIRDINEVIEELKRAKSFGYQKIHFTDEYFAAPKKYIDAFLDLYEKHIGLPVEMYLHYLQILKHPDILKRLKKLHLKSVCLGIQSGCDSFARNIYNRRVAQKDLIAFAKLIKSENIHLNIHLIVGNPLEDEFTFRKSLDFLKLIPYEKGKDTLSCFRFTPFIGSPIVNRFAEKVLLPMPQNEFERQGCLAQLRILLSDDEFLPLLDNKNYFTKPYLLKEKYYTLNNIKA